jgi:hypothetical protein
MTLIKRCDQFEKYQDIKATGYTLKNSPHATVPTTQVSISYFTSGGSQSFSKTAWSSWAWHRP